MRGSSSRGRADSGRGGGVNKGDRSRSRSPNRNGQKPTVDRERNDRMVYITNLSYDVRRVELKTLLREKAGEVIFAEVLEDREGRPKGCAIVEFQTRQGAEDCVKNLARFEFKGRNLNIKEIRDPAAFMRKVKEETGFDYMARGVKEVLGDRPQRSGTFDLFGLSPEFLRKLNIEPPLCDRVFIANLIYTLSTGRLYEIFGLAGKIVWMDLHLDKDGRSKGVCVVQYSHPIEAVQAISMFNGQRLFDRTLAVKMDQYEKVEPIHPGGLPKGLMSIGMGLGADGAPLKDVASVVSLARGGIHSSLSSMGYGNRVMPEGRVSGGSGYALSGSGSQNMGRMSSNVGHTLNTALGFGNSVSSENLMNGSQYGSQELPGVYGRQNSSPWVLIKNLPHDYTRQIVRDRVLQFGTMDTVEMIAPGCARIRFTRSQDAERMRMTLDGTSVEDRIISIEYM
ncbi:unnamed protein product [Auanema sp. JU1783]|nr:unnamed protein product [Auanema sp. JU1783]